MTRGKAVNIRRCTATFGLAVMLLTATTPVIGMGQASSSVPAGGTIERAAATAIWVAARLAKREPARRHCASRSLWQNFTSGVCWYHRLPALEQRKDWN